MTELFLMYSRNQPTINAFNDDCGLCLIRNRMSPPQVWVLLCVICCSTSDFAPDNRAAAVIFDVDIHKRRFFRIVPHQERIGPGKKLFLFSLLSFCCASYDLIDLGKEARVVSDPLLVAIREDVFEVIGELFSTNGADYVRFSRPWFINSDWTFFNFCQLSFLLCNIFCVPINQIFVVHLGKFALLRQLKDGGTVGCPNIEAVYVIFTHVDFPW